MSFLQCFNTSKHPYSSLPAEVFPCRNKTGEDGRTLHLTIFYIFETALRVVRFDIGTKRAVTSRHQDFKALLHSSFCLHFLFQNLNSLFYITANFIRRSGRHLPKENNVNCIVH